MRKIVCACVASFFLVSACSAREGGPPPVEFVSGGGGASVDLRVYGHPLHVEVDALAVQDSDTEFCPVATVRFVGQEWRGTYADAPEVCRTQYGVLGVPRPFRGLDDPERQ